MQLFTIIWTLVCAAIIIGYPLYLFNRPSSLANFSKENTSGLFNTVELLSFDVTKQLPGWSFTLDVPQITEEVLSNNPILFYLESKDTCLKLPFNNADMGYTANVYKNIGKVYVTFKSLNDGVSNFYVPYNHLSKVKILIIKSKDQRINGDWGAKPEKSPIHRRLRRAGINWNSYEDILGYFSNIAVIDFKGHFVSQAPKRTGLKTKSSILQSNKNRLYYTG
ncbi:MULTISPECIES: hypothetical protein [Flavobacteriaceae]|uniref:Uncharacterized protein n=1 Tax=Flagellimonas alvinocaridis TaxID=2530200 RepID=A0A4S8RSU5_9FLAO|nr:MULTISPECIES: hypothetical protein [Allomuricauda]MDC6361704.1 hypothetical protein [Muricauda sp. SP22]THV60881.1 hypothetical protein EZV76_00670 [Allomuricauda alvinocaridis]